jgi:hypothetical protein
MRLFSLVMLGCLLTSPAFAFCVVNETGGNIVIQAGGPPMPVYVKEIKPGQRDCYIPRKPDGIVVEIYDAAARRMRCRQSVAPKTATITVGQTCKVNPG